MTDFAKLRAERNAGVTKLIEAAAKKLGCKPEETWHTFDLEACYCACGSGGPCEHKFEGSYPIFEEEGDSQPVGYESRCTRCSLGAMSHTLATAP